MKNTSPKTTLAGVLAFVTALASQLQLQFDGDPLTLPNWGVVVTALAIAITAFFARDNDVTSKNAGAE